MRILLLLSVVAYSAVSFKAVIADTDFYSTLFKTVAEDVSGNMVCSLMNVGAILQEIKDGIVGDTKQQLLSADQTDWATIVDHLDKLGRVSYRFEQIGWYLARGFFFAEPYEPSQRFQFDADWLYYSSIESIDSSNLIAASEEFNKWCAVVTGYHITDVVSPDSLNATTSMVPVSAMYANGRLQYPFDVNNTTQRPFSMNDTSKDVPTMHIIKPLRYGKLPEINASYVEVPYVPVGKTYKMSMFLILPDRVDGFEQLKENLDKVTVKRLLQNATNHMVDLYLPKFKIESSMQLDGPLRKMGLTGMFSRGKDLYTMEKEERSLRVQFFHKALIEVNETGTEAALDTDDSSVESSDENSDESSDESSDNDETYLPRTTFDVNRPFVSIGVAIYEKKEQIHELPLFGAIIMDPQTE